VREFSIQSSQSLLRRQGLQSSKFHPHPVGRIEINSMRVSDYVVEFLVEKGILDVFLVSGGGIMYLTDAVGLNPRIRYHCNYHEQACVVAAEGYARVRNGVGACLVTTGPGAANAISALPGAFVDSIPLLVITGNVKRELIADFDKLRQLGPQEANTVAMAKPVTKYATSVRDPQKIRYEMEYAYAQATSGRPGPVFVEIPVDVQGALIDPGNLIGYIAPEKSVGKLSGEVDQVLALVREAKRPILVCGNGVHRAGAQELLRSLLDRLRIPIALPITAKDIIEEDHPLNIGVFGTAGQRRANFAIQNSDCLLAIGAGLNVQKIGFDAKSFAPKAYKIVVDIDEAQIKHQILVPDLAVQADAGDFLGEMLAQLEAAPYSASSRWLSACKNWRERYPLVVSEYFNDPEHVNSYVFFDRLSNALGPDDVVVTGDALDVASLFQSFRVKKGQRAVTSGWGAMGWCLPMAVGACVGNGGRRVICVTGDGSFQFNSQELLTISHYRLPIKIFIFNNRGYSNIRGTQDSFFEQRYVGADESSGVGNPDYRQLALAYGLGYSQIGTNPDLEEGIRCSLERPGPALCEVNISPEQRISPKASAFRRPDGTFESRPLEDMAPFLPREEVWENMHLFDDE
jgi:acetolactate synthase I/II/III large subunit